MKQTSPALVNIILVDDDSDDRDLFAEAVSCINPHAKVDLKRDGEELMEHFATAGPLPDVIFLDLNMPRKSGKECLAELRADKHYDNTPIVIYSTSLNPVDILDTFRQGATFFLRKPNSFEELKGILHCVLSETLMTKRERSRDDFVIELYKNV